MGRKAVKTKATTNHKKISASVTCGDFFILNFTAVPFRNLPVRIGSAYSNRLTLSREQSC